MNSARGLLLGAMAVSAVLTVSIALGMSGCGGGGSSTSSSPSSPSTPSGGSGTVAVTITLTVNGVSDAQPRTALGSRVRFTNNDSRPHRINSTPHGPHTDCPALNEVSTLQPGESKDSGMLNERRGCGFHDHLNPDDQRFRGQILVGIAEGDPTPPPPDY